MVWGGTLILPYLKVLLDLFVKDVVYILNPILSYTGILFPTIDNIERQIYFLMGMIFIIIEICLFIQFIISRFKAQYLPITKQECDQLGINSAKSYCDFVKKYMYNFGLSQYTRNLIYRVLSEVFHNSTINHPILEDNSSFKGKFTLLLGILGMLFLFACFVEPIIILGYYINLG